ncbi:MAG: Prefoldin subunit-domain-containing protein [Monoraphidium minutum]|nr:MAG: Prefoldin subunit-domain-containing protein [Monoraphidium minutum]
MAASPPPAPGAPGRARALSPQELSAKVFEYEAFVDGVLKRRLAAAGARRARLEAEREELAELQRGMAALQQEGRGELKTLVDIGSGVHCQARVRDTSRIYMAVGLGFHVECSLDEAAALAERRRDALQEKVEVCIQEAAQVRAHMRFVAQAIGELQQLGR